MSDYILIIQKIVLRSSAVAALGLALSAAAPALALQPLDAFLAAARMRNLDNREAAAVAAGRSFELDQSWARLLPSLRARAAYTRNEVAIEPRIPAPTPGEEGRTATLQPLHQLDASLTLEVPLVDLGAWRRIDTARAASSAAKARGAATGLKVQEAVVQTYQRLVGAEALVAAAHRSLGAAVSANKLAADRRATGFATGLDVDRAQAEVERARQALAAAELTRALARRALESLSGLTPSRGAPALRDDLRPEPALETWELAVVDGLPSVRAALEERKVAEHQGRAVNAAWFPTLSLTASERYTNAVGFGTSPLWAVGMALTWRLDLGTRAAARAASAASTAAAVREERARQSARDEIHQSWHTVRAQIARSRAARSEVRSTRRAAALARDRYRAGRGTQLEVIQADRDAFAAEVARIQADADLISARQLLRLRSGRSIATVAGGAQ